MVPALSHRLQPSVAPAEVFAFDAPFSAFDFVSSRFGSCPSVHRAFSLARADGKCKTVAVERIGAVGLLADDNAELAAMGFVGGNEILRISFWRHEFKYLEALEDSKSEDLIGYFIAKCDGDKVTAGRWYVFESVFRKYAHPHNCVTRQARYNVRVGPSVFEVPGVLFCQQNGLNKSCAHVALRSLLSRLVPDGDVAYSKLNEIARANRQGDSYHPCDGLTTAQIKAVLDAFSVSYCDMDYEAAERDGLGDIRKIHPYQNDLYTGVESGYGALLGFKLGDPSNPVSKHIIPFYGHTFNKDTWVTDAENSYFQIGADAGYIPSLNWTSSFIGHDDNFGSNFCVPRLYVKPEQVDYVVALYPNGVRLMGSDTALLALPILSELYSAIPSGNKWLVRLKDAFAGSIPQVVFRSVCIDAEKYFDTLENCRDWEGNAEDLRLVNAFRKVKFPRVLQVVEVSVPQLFAANERKIGDIVFDATVEFSNKCSTMPFLFARLPGIYCMLDEPSDNGSLFTTMPSSIVSHVSLLAI